MTKLGKTITDIVHEMDPTVICMCEVGETEKTVFEFSGDVFHLRVWIDVEM